MQVIESSFSSACRARLRRCLRCWIRSSWWSRPRTTMRTLQTTMALVTCWARTNARRRQLSPLLSFHQVTLKSGTGRRMKILAFWWCAVWWGVSKLSQWTACNTRLKWWRPRKVVNRMTMTMTPLPTMITLRSYQRGKKRRPSRTTSRIWANCSQWVAKINLIITMLGMVGMVIISNHLFKLRALWPSKAKSHPPYQKWQMLTRTDKAYWLRTKWRQSRTHHCFNRHLSQFKSPWSLKITYCNQ